MNAPRRKTRPVIFSQWVYRHLLVAYPRAHRREYGAAMAQLFSDQCRDAWNHRRSWGLVWLWLRILPDLVKTALWERVTVRRERKYMMRKMFAEFRARPAWLGVFITVFVAVFILVALSATIITFMLPEMYASRARIKVDQTPLPPSVASSPQAVTYGGDNFIPTEFEVIQSEKIMDQVVQRLDLNNVWAAKYNAPKLKNSDCRRLLRPMIELRRARNTSLIDITVYSDDKQEAARIANTIAEVFADYRRNQEQELLKAAASQNEKLKRVEIIERAEPGLRPVRPNKPLNIFLGGLIGAVLGLLVAGGVVMLGISLRKPAAA